MEKRAYMTRLNTIHYIIRQKRLRVEIKCIAVYYISTYGDFQGDLNVEVFVCKMDISKESVVNEDLECGAGSVPEKYIVYVVCHMYNMGTYSVAYIYVCVYKCGFVYVYNYVCICVYLYLRVYVMCRSVCSVRAHVMDAVQHDRRARDLQSDSQTIAIVVCTERNTAVTNCQPF